MSEWDWLEMMVTGALVIVGLVLALVAAGFVALVLLPFAIGYGIVIILWKLYDKIRKKRFPEDYATRGPITPEESERMFKQIEEDKKRQKVREELERLRSEQARQLAAEARKAPVEEDVEQEKQPMPEKTYYKPEKPSLMLTDSMYLERKLRHWEREELITKGYLRLKISPFGDSGASYFLVKARYNESKEHAFFCYLLEHELKQYTRRIVMNTNYGPDLVVEYKGKTYAFDVETGKSLTRQPDYLERKFGHYERNYDQIFIFVTNKDFKYKYSRFGYVITRGKLREVLAAVFN